MSRADPIIAIAARTAYLYLTFVGKTSRIRWVGEEHVRDLEARGSNYIWAFWHGRQVFLTFSHRDRKGCCMVSRSRDGEIMARLMALSRMGAARGSTSRGGAWATRELLALAEQGCHPAFTPDGPRGPARQVQPGVLYLAKKLGIPILPLASATSRRIILRGWDEYHVPLPFSRAAVVTGAPLYVREAGPQEAHKLKEAIDRVTEEADRLAVPRPWLLPLMYQLGFPLLAMAALAGLAFSERRKTLRSLGQGAAERLGRLPRLLQRPLWIHAASVGEVQALRALLHRIQAASGAPPVLVTTSTWAGREAARSLPGVDLAVLAPLDLSPCVRGFLQRVHPRALVLLETELWPETLRQCRNLGLPVFLVNGRLSPKSVVRYAWIGSWVRSLLAGIRWIGAQTEEDLRRFVALGAQPGGVEVTGNIKFDNLPRISPAPADGLEERLDRLGGGAGAPLLVGASTHPGEEDALAAAFRTLRRRFRSCRLVLAPRHVERAAAVCERLRQIGLRARTLSDPPGDADCLVVDAMGALDRIYESSTAVFIGGSLVPVGGHNLMEPAALGKPVLFGPHTHSIREAAEALLAAGGGRVVQDVQEIERALGELLADPAMARRMGEGGRKVLDGLQGATEKTWKVLRSFLSEDCVH